MSIFSSSRLKSRSTSIRLLNIFNRFKIAAKEEIGNSNSPPFLDILHGDPHFLFHFQVANNIFDYKTSKNMKFGPTREAL